MGSNKSRAARQRASANQVRMNDGVFNLISGLGTGRDKAAHNRYGVANMVDGAETVYDSSGLAATIVDQRPHDATREWRAWQGNNNTIGAIEAREKELDVQRKVFQAMRLARLSGGSALYIGADPADPAKPLDPARVGKGGIKYLTVFKRTDLVAGTVEKDPTSPYYGMPRDYALAADAKVKIHPSRLVLFYGAFAASKLSMAPEGWGASCLLPIFEALMAADATIQNAASMLFDATVDVHKIPGLAEGMDDPDDARANAYIARVQRWVGAAQTMKGSQKALVIDAEQDYNRQSNSFAGVSDIIDRTQQYIAGVSGYPVMLLFRRSPGGLNATGDNDVRLYYDTVSAYQRNELAPALAILDRCLKRDALGAEPEDVFYTWRPLWQLTAAERVAVGKTIAETLKTLADSRIYSVDVLAKAGAAALTEAGVLPGFEEAVNDAGKDDDADEDPPLPDDDEQQSRPELRLVRDARVQPVMVRRYVRNAATILEWAAAHGIQPAGPVSQLSVVVAYSRAPVDYMGLGYDYATDLAIEPGGPRFLERVGDAVRLGFNSSHLEWRHREMVEKGAEFVSAGYAPSLVLGTGEGVDLEAITPYDGPIILGPEIFGPFTEA